MSRAALLVEDNSSHAELISDELETALPGWTLDQAPTLADAREDGARTYDLFVFDSGCLTGTVSSCFARCAVGRQTPTIFVTTASSAKLAVDAMKLGADDYNVKEEGYLAVLPYLVQEVLKRRQLAEERQQLEDGCSAPSGRRRSVTWRRASRITSTILWRRSARFFSCCRQHRRPGIPHEVSGDGARRERADPRSREGHHAGATVPQHAREVQRLRTSWSAPRRASRRAADQGNQWRQDLPGSAAVRVHGEAATCLFLTLLQNAVRFSPGGGDDRDRGARRPGVGRIVDDRP